MGMATNQKRESGLTSKLWSPDLTSERSVVVKNYPMFLKRHKYESAFQDLSG